MYDLENGRRYTCSKGSWCLFPDEDDLTVDGSTVVTLGLSSGRTSVCASGGFSGSTNRVVEYMGQDPGFLRRRNLASLRIRKTRRSNKTRSQILRVLMLDSAGLACASCYRDNDLS
ncbi:hypothetical protein Bca4012_065511 [Brassica carinata]